MCQCLPDAAVAGLGGDIFHLRKQAFRRCVAHGNTVGNVGEHGQVIVAVAEGVGAGQIQMVIIQYVLDSGRLGVPIGHEFPKGAAPVNAVKPFVADAAERFKLRFFLIPDDELVRKKFGLSRCSGMSS